MAGHRPWPLTHAPINRPDLKIINQKTVILAALFVLAYHPVLSYLVVNWWIDPNYSHGFVVPIISGFVVYRNRDQLAAIAPEPSTTGLVVLLAGACMLAVGHVGAELFLMRASMLVVMAGLVLFISGRKMLRELTFPIAFLIFMIPLPMVIFNAVAFPLQLFAARVATEVISALGIPVLRDGNIIELAHATLEVAEACSGIRSLVTILTLATIYAYFTLSSRVKQLLLVASAVPIAILVNSSRVAITAVLAHHFGYGAIEGFYHSFEGWFMFIVSLVLLLGVDLLLRRFPR